MLLATKDCWRDITTGTGSQKRTKKQKVKYEWIECDICTRWYHGNCQGIQPEEVLTVASLDNRGVKWFCTDCFPELSKETNHSNLKKLSTIQEMITLLDNKISTFQQHTTEEVKKIEKSWAEIAAPGEISKDIKKSIQLQSTTQALLAKDLEKKDAESRKNNAILYGLPEGDSTTAMDEIKQLMNKELFKNFDVPEQAIRLGSKNDSKSRPIKLRFIDEKAKWEFMKRVNSNLKNENIFCKLDVNAQIREQEFKLRKTVRALKQGSGDEEYRIRNLTIERKERTSGEWKRMNLEELKQHTTV